ncbi:MAG TPA: hypothetical protein VEW46_12325 [Pyrinomonadaceae bacterium]|nr:hypothetical protein [Pyrinomonadaceae bacterium]
MQTATAIIHNHPQISSFSRNSAAPGWLARLFGCRHREMSRPFSIHGQAYRSCVDCGARRQFNLERWQMQGDYYYGLPTSRIARQAR